MDKGRMIYVDESGKRYVTRKLNCDMRPVRSGYGLHIVNAFRYGGIRSALEFICFAGRFAESYEGSKNGPEEKLVNEVLGRTDGISAAEAVTAWLEPECYCYVIQGDVMTIFCGREPAEEVCRRADAFEPLVDEAEFVSILETLKSGEGISPSVQDLIIHLLELLMRDWGSEISYYVYDLDFGRTFEPGMFSDRDGYVDLSCDQALYRDLVRTGF